MASGKRSVPRNKKISRKYVRRRILVLLVFLCLLLGLLYGLYRLVAAGIAAIGKKQQPENTPPPVETALSTPPPATALPELVTTLTAIRKKESSLSVGNIIGANIMDLTLILPLCSLILGKPLPVQSQGMLLDIPACLVICAAVLVPALWKGKFQRWMGFLAGGLYIVYLTVMFTCFGA